MNGVTKSALFTSYIRMHLKNNLILTLKSVLMILNISTPSHKRIGTIVREHKQKKPEK